AVLAACFTSTPGVTRRSPTAARRRLVMRIALVASHSSSPGPADSGGRGQRVSSLADALAGLGPEGTVYAPKDAPKLPRKAPLALGGEGGAPAGRSSWPAAHRRGGTGYPRLQ